MPLDGMQGASCRLLLSAISRKTAAQYQRDDHMSSNLCILMVEDSAADVELIEHELLRARVAFSSRHVHNEADFLTALNDVPPDLVLADYSLPAFSGKAALAICRRQYPDVPFIFISGTVGEERAVELMRLGATDFVPKQ